MVKLKTQKTDSIHVSEMQDGELAVITQWTDKCFIGSIVQRYSNSLICLGCHYGHSWSNLFNFNRGVAEECRVRLLEAGEELVIL